MQITQQQTLSTYELFRKTPVETWRATGDKAIVPSSQLTELLTKQGLDPVKASSAIRVLGLVAHECTAEEFHDAMTKNELPPVKLSPRDMETARGGIIPVLWCIAVALAGFDTPYLCGL